MIRTLLGAGLMMLALCVHAALPTTPAGQVLGRWLEAFNAGDPARIQAFDARHAGTPRPIEQTLEFRAETGGFTLLRVERSEPLALTVLLQERESDRLAQMAIEVSADEVPRVLALSIRPAPRPPELALPRLTQAGALAALADRADQLAAADRFAGSLLVARDGQPLLQRHWGLADREARKPITPDTQFRIGSMNKMFTAVALLQLVEAGKLALDDPIGKHLPSYPNRDAAAKVTLRHLLTHSGGTGDFFGPEFDQHRQTLRDPADYVARFGSRALEFEPGTRFEYSNYGYVLLGAVIEAVTGERYDAVVQRAVLDPAGMTATGAAPETEALARRAKGYMRDPRDGRTWVSNADTLPWRGSPAGGGYSTVGDLLRFAQALQAGKLLSKAMLAEATREQQPGYGYGFGVGGEGATRRFGHNGGAPGMNGDLRIFPALGLVIIALSNVDPPTATRFVDFYTLRMPTTR